MPSSSARERRRLWVRGDGVGGALALVQSCDQLTVERLAQRMRGGIVGDVGGDLSVAVCAEVSLEPHLNCLQMVLDKVRDLRRTVKGRKLGHRPATPQGQCRGALLLDGLPVTRAQDVLSTYEVRAEDLRIKFAGAEPKGVGTPVPLQPAALWAEQRSQSCEKVVQRGERSSGRMVAPHSGHEAIDRLRHAGLQQHSGQQYAGLGPWYQPLPRDSLFQAGMMRTAPPPIVWAVVRVGTARENEARLLGCWGCCRVPYPISARSRPLRPRAHMCCWSRSPSPAVPPVTAVTHGDVVVPDRWCPPRGNA